MHFLSSARHEATTENYPTAHHAVHGYETYQHESNGYDERKRHWSSTTSYKNNDQLPSKRRRSDAEISAYQNPNMNKIQQNSKMYQNPNNMNTNIQQPTSNKKEFVRSGGYNNQQQKSAMERHLKLHNPVGTKGKTRRSKQRFTFYRPFSLDAKNKLKDQLDKVQASLVPSEHTKKAQVSLTLTRFLVTYPKTPFSFWMMISVN